MPLDVSGLRPLDTTGLRRADASEKPTLDVGGLKKLDTSGLKPAFKSWQDEFQHHSGKSAESLGFTSPQQANAWLFANDRPMLSAGATEDSWLDVGRRFVENIPTAFKRQAGGLLRGLAEQEFSPGGTAGMFLENDPVIAEATAFRREQASAPGGLGDVGARIFDEATAALEANAPNVDPGSLKQYAYDIAQGIVNMTPAVAGSMVTRNPKVGMTIIGAQVAGDRYGESRAAGRTPGEAAADAGFYTLAEAIPERLPLGVLVNGTGGILKRTLKAAGAEGVQEMFTEVLQTAYDTGVIGENEDMTWGEFVNRVKRAGIVGAGVGGGLAVATHPFRRKPGQDEIDPETGLPTGSVQAETLLGEELLTEDDRASPIPDDLIAQGKQTIAEATTPQPSADPLQNRSRSVLRGQMERLAQQDAEQFLSATGDLDLSSLGARWDEIRSQYGDIGLSLYRPLFEAATRTAGGVAATSDSSMRAPAQSPAQQVVDALNGLNPQLNGALRIEVLSADEMASRATRGGYVSKAGQNGAVINLREDASPSDALEEARHMVDMLLGNREVSRWIAEDAALSDSVNAFLKSRGDDLAPGANFSNEQEVAQALLDQYFRNPDLVQEALPDLFQFLESMGAAKYRGALQPLYDALAAESATSVGRTTNTLDTSGLRPVASVSGDNAPAPGKVRMYHGATPGNGPTGARWFTSDPDYAKRFGSKDNEVWYVDLDENDPLIAPEYPEQSVSKGFTVARELPSEIARQAMRLESTAGQSGNPASPPPFDPRLKREEFRAFLNAQAADLVKGGGVAYIRDPKTDAITGRTKSQNPGWFKAMNEVPELAMSVQQTQRAIQKALNGEKLGVREQRVVSALLDDRTRTRTTGEDPVYGPPEVSPVEQARQELMRRREERRAERGMNVQPRLGDVSEQAFQDLYANIGEQYDEQEYPPEWSFDERALFDAAAALTEAGGDARPILQNAESTNEPIESTLESFEAALEAAYGPERTQEAAAPGPVGVAADQPQQAQEAPAAAPAAVRPQQTRLDTTPTPGPVDDRPIAERVRSKLGGLTDNQLAKTVRSFKLRSSAGDSREDMLDRITAAREAIDVIEKFDSWAAVDEAATQAFRNEGPLKRADILRWAQAVAKSKGSADGLADINTVLNMGYIRSWMNETGTVKLPPGERKGAGAAQGKPIRQEEVFSGAPVEGVGYRVNGIDPKRLYNGTESPVMGPGQYSALSPDGARFFAQDDAAEVVETPVSLKNPLVIRSGEEWKTITKAAGWDLPSPFGKSVPEVERMTAALQSYVKGLGHDGIAVLWDDSEPGDISKSGGNIKLLRSVFGQPQIVAFGGVKPSQTSEARDNASREARVADAIRSEWNAATGGTSFAPDRDYPLTVTVDGTTVQFVASRKTFAGPIRLARLTETSKGPVVTRYTLDNAGNLKEQSAEQLWARPKDYQDAEIARFRELFNSAEPAESAPSAPATPPRTDLFGDVPAAPVTDQAKDDPAAWWDKELTAAGRRAAMQKAGVNLPDRVLWNYVSDLNRAKLLKAREQIKREERAGATDMTGTLFGQDRQQTDLMDAAGVDTRRPAQAGAITSAPSDEGRKVSATADSALRGDRIDGEWVRFSNASGSLNIPRDDMPQVKAEHRGALANFLKARGIEGAEDTVPAASLKPTQAEFSEKKVQKAKEFEGGDRAILVSADGHVLDGHHQWVAKADQGEDVRIIRLDAPIRQLLEVVPEFPSAETSEGAAPPSATYRERAERLLEQVTSSRQAGIAAAIREIADGRDPSGGMVSLDRQLDELERQLRSLERIPEPQWWADITPARRYFVLKASGIKGTAQTPWNRLSAEDQRALHEQWGPKGEQAPAQPQPAAPADAPLRIEDFSEKAIIVRGQTRENIDRIKGAINRRPLWNKKAGGWIFPKAREADVRKALADLLAAPVAPETPESAAPTPQPAPAQTPQVDSGYSAEWRERMNAIADRLDAIGKPLRATMIRKNIANPGDIPADTLLKVAEETLAKVVEPSAPAAAQPSTGRAPATVVEAIGKPGSYVVRASEGNTIATFEMRENGRLGRITYFFEAEQTRRYAREAMDRFVAERAAQDETPASMPDAGLSGASIQESQPVTIEPPEEGSRDGVQGSVPASDEGAGPADVQPTAPDGGDGRAPGDEVGGGASDVRGTDRERAEASGRTDDRSGVPGSREGGTGDTDRVPRRPAAERDAGRVKGENYRIQPGALAEDRGRIQKARDNIRAIELMREIEAAGRPATTEEQQALARYVGWGGIKGAFPDADGNFEKGLEAVGARLRELLTDTEYATARRSLQYAHYTAESVVRAMWDAARRLGFNGGKVFEPGMGVGNFAGLMPADIAEATNYHGLELDHTTARIARLLYPRWGVRQDDFTKAPLPRDTYDLVIGNPPFADVSIQSDAKYPQGFLLHDYFFAKSLDAVRPGGLLMFISSAGTMNKLDAAAREYMADRADLVGAIRLPGNAFEKNAGTSVTTDIVILRKRLPGETAGDRAWTETTEVTLPNKEGKPTRGRVSKYFADNPLMVLGEEGFFDPLYEGRYAVRAPGGFDLEMELRWAIGALPEQVMSDWQDTTERAEVDFGTSERKDGSFYIGKDGALMQQSDGVGVPVKRRGKGVEGGRTMAEIERIEALIPVRDALRSVYAADLAEDATNAEAARKRLNESYDAFVKRFGPINKAEFQYRRPTVIQQESARAEAREEARFNGDPWNEGTFDATRMIESGATLAQIAKARKEAREAAQKAGRPFDEGSFNPDDMPDVVIEKRPNIDPFMDDPESYRLRAIEHHNDQTGEARKSDVFVQNIITRDREPEIKGINDALLHTLNQRGRLDIDHVAHLAGLSTSEAIEQLGDGIFLVPGTDNQWVTRDEYLSGNVRSKLRQARAAAARNPELQRNVDALEAAQPAPLPPSEINANLGMPWIPTDVIEQFGKELGLSKLKVTYLPKLAQWEVSGDQQSAAARQTWGTEDVQAPALIKDALNRQDPKVYRESRDPDGKKVRVLDTVATQAAQDKAREIKLKFADWVWSDPERAAELAAYYNEEYNNLVVREYNGDYLTTPGISASWSWRPHQTRVIARIIQSGNTYMAHSVGAGKTSAMIGAGMEMRRLGLVRKPMYVVPNHMLGQFTKEFYEQYPTARIAVADERRFHTDRRKQFIANVAADDLDAVIITHSAFGMIPVSDAFQDALVQQQIAEYRSLLTELKVNKEDDNRITRSRIEKQIERLEQRLTGRGTGRKDQVFTFEEMGVDFLFVDEAHLFRKLDFSTKMSNVKGVSPEGSKSSWDLYVKSRYLESVNPGRNLVLASGTPVTNTMAELFTVSRYLQMGELESRSLGHFDAWAGAFGDTVTNLEQDPSGGYKSVTRFAKFVNVPELSNMVRQVMDVVTGRQLEQYVTRPQLKGGKRQMNLAEGSEALGAYQAHLAARMEAIAKRRGPPAPGDDIILSVINDGRHAAIDMRLVNPALPNDPGSKLNLLVDNVFRIWKETKRQPLHKPESGGYSAKPVDTGPATQMIFANLGLSGTRGFSVPDYIRSELVRRGVPKNEIAMIADYTTHVAKQRLFNDMNEGRVRVLIGSTAKMATGVNAQRRLYAVHNLDPLWYPADDEQRNGRIIRQGNMNPEVEIHDYSTKGTYDSTMWGLMETKARFIQGFFEGDPSLRDMEDLGEASQYEQAKAMTTADPRLIELTDLRQNLERAFRRKVAFEREQYAIGERISRARSAIGLYEGRVAAIQKDIARREDTTGDKFRIVVGSRTFTDRVEAGDAILGELELLKAKRREVKATKIGSIGGFDLVAEIWKLRANNQDEYRSTLTVARSGSYETEAKVGESAIGAIRSIEYVLRGFEGDLEDATSRLETARKDLADYTPKLGLKFQGDAEIADLTERVRELEAALAQKELVVDAQQEEAAQQAPIVDARQPITGWAPGMRGAELSGAERPKFSVGRDAQVDTPAFKRWFGDSKVVDADGKPLVVYHWTDYEFDAFRINNLEGAHFGTAEAASDRARGMDKIGYDIEKERDGWWVFADAGPLQNDAKGPFPSKKEASDFVRSQPKRIEPLAVYLSIQNPVRLPDLGTWGVWDIIRNLPSGTFTVADVDAIMEADSRYDALRDALLRKGIDGFVYENQQEDPGSVSYIALRPEQIKSAVGNRGTFDPNDQRITYRIRSDAEVEDRLNGALADLEKRLRDVGIDDRIAVRLKERLPHDAEGFYWPSQKLIQIAMNTDQAWTMDHEIIHALRDLGLFRAAEWRMLEAAARSDVTRMKRVRSTYAFLDLTEEELLEEGIADMHADWRAKRLDAKGFIRTAFERIAKFFEALGNALRGRGFYSAADVLESMTPVFEEIESGRLGRRGLSRSEDREERVAAVRAPPARMSLPDDAMRDWGRQIAAMTKSGKDSFVVKVRAPRVLQHLAIADDVSISLRRFRAIHNAHPDVPMSVFAGLPDLLADPLYVYRRSPRSGRGFGETNIVIETVTADGEPILVGMKGGEILTITPKHSTPERSGAQVLAREIALGDLLYARNEEALRSIRASYGDRLQSGILPGPAEAGSGPGRRDRKVLLRADIVNAEDSPRFALRGAASDPTQGGIEERQKAANQWYGSQPLDHAMRLPFSIFGGINERGEWEWGARLNKKAADIITNATFSDEGRFAWINPTLERARAGLLDRYGLSSEYVERERQRGLDERRIMAQVPEIMQALKEAKIGADEAKVLQAVLTGEAVADADMAKLAEPIRNAIDDMGAEAVNLGLLSAESFERNRGAYLHRVYQKHENDQGGLVRFVARMAGRQRKKIIGEQFKGRGMWIEVEPAKLMRLIPGFQKGERGGPVAGEKFRVLDKIEGEGTGTLRDIDPNSQPRVLNRVFLREGDPIPPKLMGYADRGIWEVRGFKSGKPVLWRDFTKDERTKMGEIVDARYTIAKTYMGMAHDLATGRFFKDISLNADWSRPDEPRASEWKDASEYSRYWADPSVQWVRVPDTKIPKSNTLRYGALAGRYVRAEIWRDLHELDLMNRANFWNTLLTQWKLNKTARSPVVHMNNIVSNVVLMDMADVRALDLVRGIRAMVRKDKDYQDAVDHGAFGSDMVAQEIRRDLLLPILEELQREMQGGQDTIEAKFGVVGKVADAIWRGGKNIDRKMLNLYQLEDEVFRMAAYMRKRADGHAPDAAALMARDQFLNYDIRAPWINAARRSVLPFISYTYRAVPVIAQSMMLRPWKLAKYATIAYAVNALAYALTGGDEDEERRSLRGMEEGRTWLGLPRMIRMPWNDRYGNPVFLDIRRWIPAGDVFDINQGQGAIPLPAPLQFGGPVMLAFEFALNKQAFTGKEIVNDATDDWWDRTSKVADWGWKSWMPSAAYIPGSWYWEKMGNAMTGARDTQGRPYDIPSALASSVGVKLKSQDVKESFFWKGVEFDNVERELKAQLRSLERDRSRGMISQSAFESRKAKIFDKMANLGEERRQTFTPSK